MAKQVFLAADGSMHETASAANEHDQKPAVLAALAELQVSSEDGLLIWEKRATIEDAFDSGTIRRVTKADTAALTAALAASKELYNKLTDLLPAVNQVLIAGKVAQFEGNPFKDLKFISENSEAISKSFKHLTVPKMTDAEKVALARNTLVANGFSAELAAALAGNIEGFRTALKAGRPVRELSEKCVLKRDEHVAKVRAETEKKRAECAARRATKLAENPDVIFKQEDFANGQDYTSYRRERARAAELAKNPDAVFDRFHFATEAEYRDYLASREQ